MLEFGILFVLFTISLLLIYAVLQKKSAIVVLPPSKAEVPEPVALNTAYEKQPYAVGHQTEPELKTSNQFIQTMSATFAHLQIGIAVFDKRNELSLFNPALSQHLGLRPEWLLKRPNLPGFFDRLRDTHILPEPKNYMSWRKTFLKIERSAMKDDYRQDWDLPDGRSLRVIGRPHASGTVVFLFEDVTEVLAMERSFRGQLSNLENILNSTTIGLVAFDRSGKAIFQNKTIKQALGARSKFKSIQGFCEVMQVAFNPTPIWGDLRQYVEDSERSAWQASIATEAGEIVMLNFEPVSTGETLCEFHFPVKIIQKSGEGLTCAAL